MKEQIYTIPIGEAYDDPDGCPICRLHSKLEGETLAYTLGAAMMEPDVRVTMNAQGFCAMHLDTMLHMKNRLGLALILESRLGALLAASGEQLAAMSDNCFVCARTAGFMDKCVENVVYLWETQEEFREKMQSHRHCFKHTAQLIKVSKTVLRRKNIKSFAESMAEQIQPEITALKESVTRFTKSFDHRFAGQDLGEDKSAVERACAWMSE